MTKSMTPKTLIKYMKNFDYELSLKQANDILRLCDECFGIFTSQELQMATDYIVMKDKSIFYDYF